MTCQQPQRPFLVSCNLIRHVLKMYAVKSMTFIKLCAEMWWKICETVCHIKLCMDISKEKQSKAIILLFTCGRSNNNNNSTHVKRGKMSVKEHSVYNFLY